MTTASINDVCGVSGLGTGGLYTACNFYAPGSSGGKIPEFAQFTKGTRGYNTDWNNLAPNIGAAWRPNVEGGWLRALLGDPAQATIRVGQSVLFDFPADMHNVIFQQRTGKPADIPATSSQAITRTFATVGTFPFDCTLHPGMSGTVFVTQ